MDDAGAEFVSNLAATDDVETTKQQMRDISKKVRFRRFLMNWWRSAHNAVGFSLALGMLFRIIYAVIRATVEV